MTTQLGDYIEAAVEKIGSVKEVAELVGVSRSSLSDAKSNRHGIPAASCVVLAQIVGAEPLAVIAANEMVTETREERKAVWLPFVTAEKWRRGWDSNPR